MEVEVDVEVVEVVGIGEDVEVDVEVDVEEDVEEDVDIEVGGNVVVVVTGGGVASKLRSVFLILEVK